ncbi:MAG: hypothetical protein IJ757_08810 [Clostridiales bacterium]|nr:hypothetical protein [Clostridiales bacterium]
MRTAITEFFHRDHIRMRIALSVIGVAICGIAVGFFKFAMFGVDPFTSFMCGLDEVVPIQYGTLYVIANAVLLIFSLIFDRHYVGLGTILNLFFVGYLAQFTEGLLIRVAPEGMIAARIICLIIGVLMLSFSAALYMPADLGVSTYDAVALIIANTWKKGKFKYVRVITDFVCVILGTILFLTSGQPVKMLPTIVGIGTLITAFCMGPLIVFFTQRFTKKYLLK